VTDDTVFIGAESGNVYALDRATGCTRWVFEADGDIRTAIVHGAIETGGRTRTALFFGTFGARAYAVDAATGELIWQKQMDEHPFSVLTGTPIFHEGRLYVPVSAYEVIIAVAPFYGCCDFRGSVVAVDAATGEEIWRRYTIDQPAEVTGTRWFLVEEKGPSGAPVWQAPAVDAERGLLYFATGENYSDPATDTSDSVFAVDLEDGSVRWHRQFTADDAWNSACGAGWLDANCPDADGPDYDFGAPPVLARTAYGREVLLAGQKSSMVYAMNPDNGELLWERRVGRGGKLGGIHWGMAVNEAEGLLYVPVSDRGTGGSHETHDPDPGLHALSINDGTVRWSVARGDNCADREGCFPGVSAAITATDDLVFAGTLDGRLQAFDGASGELLWSYDTWRSFDAVNGLETEGGPIDVHGPLVQGDMVFVTAGYATFGQKSGNAFLAFRLTD
jgi:polyvinyl alcohol dehydrogenase (cytochrome)